MMQDKYKKIKILNRDFLEAVTIASLVGFIFGLCLLGNATFDNISVWFILTIIFTFFNPILVAIIIFSIHIPIGRIKLLDYRKWKQAKIKEKEEARILKESIDAQNKIGAYIKQYDKFGFEYLLIV